MRNLASVLVAIAVAFVVTAAQSVPDTSMVMSPRPRPPPDPSTPASSRGSARRRRRRPRATPRPPRRGRRALLRSETWYAKPVKVFDNLYFVGQTEYSAWAVTTSDGIIIIDPIFDYSVEDEVVNGLKSLGSRSQHHQVRARQPRALRSRRRRFVSAGSLQRQGDHVRRGLDACSRARAPRGASRSASSSPPTARS